MDHYLQGTPYINQVHLLTGFAAFVRSGGTGRRCQVATQTVSTALTAIGQTIALAIGLSGSEKLIPRLSQMLDGWQKDNPATAKKLPVKADVPAYLCRLGAVPTATALEQAMGDLTLIAFYYLL